MPRAQWSHVRNRPAVELSLVDPLSGQPHKRKLLADCGAGSALAPFELVLTEEDCLRFAIDDGDLIRLRGAFAGEFRTYAVQVRMSELRFSEVLTAVGVEYAPPGFEGIAGFRFLNRFAFGNFGSRDSFGLETLWS
jgi:hypothetical protein